MSERGVHALLQGIQMLRVIKQFRTQEDKPVDLRIGINTGDVLTG